MAVNHLSSAPISEFDPPPVENWAHTQTKMYKINFTWTLNNFSFLDRKVTQESPIFYGGPNDEIKWCLRLRTQETSTSTSGSENLCTYLKLVSEPNNKSKVLGKYKVCILDEKYQKTNELIISQIIEFKVSDSNPPYYYKLIQRKNLLDEASTLLPEDTLTIVCEIEIVAGSIDFSGRKTSGNFIVPESKLAEDFGNLLDTKLFSDVTLVVDKHEYPVHKAILAARSHVFAAMFESEMEEAKLNRVNITDIHRDVLQQVIRFIYTENAPKLKEMADLLLAAADKYELNRLKVACEEALFAELSIETAAQTLVLADRHNANQLKEKTSIFIKTHGKDVIKTDGWQNMKKLQQVPVCELFEVLFIKQQQQ